MTRSTIRLAGIALGLGSLLLSPALAAPSASQIYDQKLSDYAKVQEVKFNDDHTNVGGKAYDFARASLEWFGVPGEALDAADFVRSVRNEGVTSANVLTLVTRTVAGNASTKQFESVIKKLDDAQLLEIATALHLGKSTDLQKTILKYVSETAPTAAGQASGGDATAALTTVLVDVMKKACKTCGVAYTGYQLAKEAAKAADMVFENDRTQAMFSQMAKAGWYRFDEFKDGFSGGVQLKDEARGALTKINQSMGRPPPTDDELMQYIYSRYQRWRTEIQSGKEDAEVLAAVKDSYLTLASYDKEEMFGAGTEEEWASKFMSAYMPLYNEFVSYRGDNPWPFGLGKEAVRQAVFALVQKKLSQGLSDEEVAYEMRKYLAEWGWIPRDKIGTPPASPVSASAGDRAAIVKGVTDRLGSLNKAKLDKVFDRIGVKPTDAFFGCLCPSGFYYYTGPEGGPCRYDGPLWGHDYAAFDGSKAVACAAANPLPDGRSVIDAIADAASSRK